MRHPFFFLLPVLNAGCVNLFASKMQGRYSFRGAVSAINALQRQSIISLRSQSWPVVKNIYSEPLLGVYVRGRLKHLVSKLL
jgi:hypothetical protein